MSASLSSQLRDYLPRLTHRPLRLLIERAADRIDALEREADCRCGGSKVCPDCHGLSGSLGVACHCHGTGSCVPC